MPTQVYTIDYQQKGQWLLNQVRKKNPLQNQVQWTQYETIDLGVFKRALAALIERHESLRTTFTVRDGVVMHQVHPAESLNLDAVLTVHTDQKEPAFYAQLLPQEQLRPFALDQWPLFRVQVFVHQGNTYVLYCIHHVISDPFTLAIIEQSFGEIYGSLIHGEPVSAPRCRQFREYFAWKESLLHGAPGAAARTLWVPRVAEIKKSRASGEDAAPAQPYASPDAGGPADADLALLRSVMPLAPVKGSLFTFYLEREAMTELKVFGRRYGHTPFTLLMAGFSILVNHVTGRNCNLITFSASNRDAFPSDDLIGWVVSSAYFYSHLAADCSFADLLDYVGAELVRAMENRFYAIENILKDGGLLIPYNQIVPLYMNYLLVDQAVATGPPTHETDQVFEVSFDLNCTIRQYTNAVEVACTYNQALFSPETIEALFDEYRSLLHWFTRNPDASVHSYRLPAFPKTAHVILSPAAS